MKKLFKNSLLLAAIAFLSFSMTSCGGSNNDEKEEADKALKTAIVDQYLNHTIFPTYTNLANATDELVVQLKALKKEPTQDKLDKACEIFLNARAWWEKSEAFLFGAASDFGIDPHIDSWPLDETAFMTLMNNHAMLELLNAEDGDIVAGEQLGNALLGFHGIEYILFENGAAKDVKSLTDDELIYVVAVSGDLRNRCVQLEVSWKGSSASKEHQDLMEELEFNTTVNSGSNSYGDNMRKSGEAGSTYVTFAEALAAIIDGCIDISDEVGTSKIGKPHTGEDIHYVESPYSYNSITDFHNNIISVKNAYMGGNEGERNESNSVHNYMTTIDQKIDSEVLSAIENALAKINNMAAPFVNNINDPTAGEAMEACVTLSEKLSNAKTALTNYNR